MPLCSLFVLISLSICILRHFSGKVLINFVLQVVQYILSLSFKATKLVSERFCFVYTQSSHEKVPGCLSFVLAITQFYTACIGTCMMQELFKIAKIYLLYFWQKLKKLCSKRGCPQLLVGSRASYPVNPLTYRPCGKVIHNLQKLVRNVFTWFRCDCV